MKKLGNPDLSHGTRHLLENYLLNKKQFVRINQKRKFTDKTCCSVWKCFGTSIYSTFFILTFAGNTVHFYLISLLFILNTFIVIYVHRYNILYYKDLTILGMLIY